MSDFRRNESSAWLEKELSRQLAPAAAPVFLWDRINAPTSRPRALPGGLPGWSLWPLVAGAALLICAGAFWSFGATRGLVSGAADKLSEQELAALTETSKGSGFRSNDPAGIRAWVKAAANIDIDLPAEQTTIKGGPVRLLGARLTHLRGVPIVAIDYRTGDEIATLLVSSQPSALTGNTDPAKHLVSWNMRNQTYTIAFPGTKDAHGACVLCHANTPGLLMPAIN
jgi:hypothetical protein